jgi:type IV pilus biogenesis protein CpaD/CtpE
MRAALILVCALVFSGCAHSNNKKKGGRTQKSITTIPAPTVVRPVTKGSGVVLSVNETLRFVVIDFSSAEIPPLNTRLNVYRAGQKVAELNLSGPIRNSNVVADIRAGETKVGDEVRMD